MPRKCRRNSGSSAAQARRPSSSRSFSQADPSALQRLLGFFHAFFGRRTVIDQRQFDVVKSCRAWQQIESLKYEADFPIANVSQFVIIQIADQSSRQPVAPCTWRIQAADKVHQCGFPRSRRPHDRHVFALADFEVNALQRMYKLRAHLVRLG